MGYGWKSQITSVHSQTVGHENHFSWLNRTTHFLLVMEPPLIWAGQHHLHTVDHRSHLSYGDRAGQQHHSLAVGYGVSSHAGRAGWHHSQTIGHEVTSHV